MLIVTRAERLIERVRFALDPRALSNENAGRCAYSQSDKNCDANNFDYVHW
ncbi:hypothetical protein [Paraburkholderia sp.]|uniref:hypothetical protein n=1 Tax=Paraburkholderia sp. TaxID=1926495 RepID=UPI0025D305D1|nr:hypothetical protein [Paraburkholderia sp.]